MVVVLMVEGDGVVVVVFIIGVREEGLVLEVCLEGLVLEELFEGFREKVWGRSNLLVFFIVRFLGWGSKVDKLVFLLDFW